MIDQQAGIFQFTSQLVKALEQYGMHNYVLFGTEPVESGLELVRLKRSEVSFLSPARYGIGSAVSAKQWDLNWMVDTTHFGTYGLFKDIRKCRMIHDLTPIMFPKYHRKKTVIGHALLFKRSLLECATLVLQSTATARDLKQYAKSIQNIHTIYPGIDEKIKASRTFEAKEYFLQVGTIEPRKNHAVTISAFDQYCDRGGSGGLVIAGADGWGVDLKNLIKWSKYQDRIEHRGFVSRDELIQLYQEATALVFPSFYEGLGLPVLEAMKAGCPVITSKNTVMHEAVGDAAIVVDPRSAEELAAAMMRMTSDSQLRDRMILAGHKRAESFTWENFVKRLEQEVLVP